MWRECSRMKRWVLLPRLHRKQQALKSSIWMKVSSRSKQHLLLQPLLRQKHKPLLKDRPWLTRPQHLLLMMPDQREVKPLPVESQSKLQLMKENKYLIKRSNSSEERPLQSALTMSQRLSCKTLIRSQRQSKDSKKCQKNSSKTMQSLFSRARRRTTRRR